MNWTLDIPFNPAYINIKYAHHIHSQSGIKSQKDIQGKPRLCISPHVMAKLGIFRFLPTTSVHMYKNKCIHNLRSMHHFTPIYLHTQTAEDMQVTYVVDELHLVLWLRERPEDPQFEPHVRIKNGTGSGMSLVYLWIRPHKKTKLFLVRRFFKIWWGREAFFFFFFLQVSDPDLPF